MRVDGDRAGRRGEGSECYFGRFCGERGGVSFGEGDFGGGGKRGGMGKGGTYWVVVAEAETETVCLVEVEGVGVEDSDVHLPFFEVGSGD